MWTSALVKVVLCCKISLYNILARARIALGQFRGLSDWLGGAKDYLFDTYINEIFYFYAVNEYLLCFEWARGNRKYVIVVMQKMISKLVH